MSDKLSSATTGAKEALRTTLKEVGHQVLGAEEQTRQQKEHAEKIQKKAQESGKTPEEEAKIESLRKKLHQEMTAPPPKSPEQPVGEEEDKVGTNETRQDLGDPMQGPSGSSSSSSSISSKKVERLKIRE